jgi:hypothetical protein
MNISSSEKRETYLTLNTVKIAVRYAIIPYHNGSNRFTVCHKRASLCHNIAACSYGYISISLRIIHKNTIVIAPADNAENFLISLGSW